MRNALFKLAFGEITGFLLLVSHDSFWVFKYYLPNGKGFTRNFKISKPSDCYFKQPIKSVFHQIHKSAFDVPQWKCSGCSSNMISATNCKWASSYVSFSRLLLKPKVTKTLGFAMSPKRWKERERERKRERERFKTSYPETNLSW